jgi:phage shock protein PspC (stress-responsive transcriptional regulator)
MTSTPSSDTPPVGPDAPADQSSPAYEQAPAYQQAAASAGPRVTSEAVRDLGRLRRIATHRKVAGVAGGIARHLDIDPLIVRVAFVVLSLFGGAGVIVYAACWILLPEDGQVNPPLGLDERSRSVALILVGILGIALLVGQWDWFWVPGPLILVALVVWLFMSRRNDAATTGTFAPPPGVPNAGPDAVTPEQRWAPAQTAVAPTYGVPVEQQPTPYEGATYQQPTYPQAAYPPPPAAPTYPTHYVAPSPRNPRKRGTILFWFTMAVAALAVGVVGIVDVSGAPVAGSTYPAVVVGVVGVMLLIGSFYGRAGGLILVGLLATGATAAALGAEKWDGDRVEIVPDSASEVLSTYDYEMGEYVLDLSRLTDPEELDGRTITMNAEVGELEVIVPSDKDDTVTGTINGPGGTTLFGEESGGIDHTATRSHDGGTDAPELELDLELEVGHIEVRTR